MPVICEDPKILEACDHYAGVMIYGGNSLSLAGRYDQCKTIFSRINEDKLRGIFGLHTPVEILIGVLAGADIFESNYPLVLSNVGKALYLPVDLAHEQDYLSKVDLVGNDMDLALAVALEKGGREKLIDLSLKEHQVAEGPIQPGCGCYTCTNYSRSYLHHLF